MTCNCGLSRCIKCKDIELKKAQMKLNRYEQALKILMDDSIVGQLDNNNYNNHNNYDNSHMYESIIIEKDMEGNQNKKIRSDLGQSFLILDRGKNIDELDKIERKALNKQNELKEYENYATYYRKGNSIYGIFSTIAKVGALAFGVIL